MANTPNLDLVKPAGTDHALVSVINSNSDKIDAGYGTLSEHFENFRLRTLSGSSIDLDDYYGTDKAGFYYIGTDVVNSPGPWSGMIVIAWGNTSYQLAITSDNHLKFRRRVGSPPTWETWVDLGTKHTGTVTKNASGITDANFHLDTEIISGTLLMVTGYINVTTAIANNTKIATVSIAPKKEAYQSVVSSAGKTGRFKLNANGEIYCESALEANSGYYSMTFVSNYV